VSLAKECAGIRTANSDLAQKLRAIGAGAPRVESAKGRGFDANWLARLHEWSA
jgi:hypothetical protein